MVKEGTIGEGLATVVKEGTIGEGLATVVKTWVQLVKVWLQW